MSTSENSATSEVHEVEWIERKRIDNNGVTSYFIKWKGFGESENTWESEETLKCRIKLLKEFELRCELDPTLVSDPTNQSDQTNDEKSGFDEGLTAEKIIGATAVSGELHFLVKWKEVNEASLVKASLMEEKCLQMVLMYLISKVPL